MKWSELTKEERFRFCEEKCPELHTCLDWNDLSPTSQLLLKVSGITDKAIYE
jgi:hypothetical protein